MCSASLASIKVVPLPSCLHPHNYGGGNTSKAYHFITGRYGVETWPARFNLELICSLYITLKPLPTLQRTRENYEINKSRSRTCSTNSKKKKKNTQHASVKLTPPTFWIELSTTACWYHMFDCRVCVWFSWWCRGRPGENKRWVFGEVCVLTLHTPLRSEFPPRQDSTPQHSVGWWSWKKLRQGKQWQWIL